MTTMIALIVLLPLAQIEPIHREEPDDPYRPGRIAEPAGAIALPGIGEFGVQVNVDANGGNITGDAANEPSIAVDPTAPNRIVIGWRQFDTIESNFRQAGWAYSHDGGRTWTFPGVIQAGTFRSDPVLAADAEGTIYYCSLRGDFSVWFFKSFDGGVTWGPPAYAWGGDKQWFTIDRTGGIGHGNIYMSWNTAANCCGDNIYNRSTDGGLTFMEPRPTPGEPIFGQQDVTADGRLFIAGIFDSFDTFLVISSPNAQNPAEIPEWDLAVGVDMGGSIGWATGPNPGGLLGQVNLAADRSDGPTAGNLYMLCSIDPPGSDPLDVMLVRSSDGGVTWSAPVRVNDDPPGPDAWQWFGTMSVSPDGRIDVVWNDTRNSGLANVSQLFYSFSLDAGVTWSPNVALSPSWNSHIGWPNQNKIGDYYDMISDRVGADLACAATFNGEHDVYYLRIGGRDCNGNGVADADDLAGETSLDCNDNGIPDECEIAAGTAGDANDDGVPDCCQVPFIDCNGNGVSDPCDLEGPTSKDCNDNGAPDECDIDDGGSADLNGNGIPDECEDCNGNGILDDLDIADGTSQDCNGNQLPDECDIADGTSTDLNGNEVPDECEDCNGNGIPDDLDIADGTSQDCNDNAVPDSCDIDDGTSPDINGNGVPDECECLPDLNGDGQVAVQDFLWVLSDWGSCAGCQSDLDGDGQVGVTDFLILLAHWGPCP